MSRRAPYFEGYLFLGEIGEPEDQLRAKIISGQIKAHVYSAEAKGDFEPVPISAAQFLIADEAGWEGFSDPHEQLPPFQIATVDRDARRRVRRSNSVPHWIYIKREVPPTKAKGGRPPKFDRAAVAEEVDRLMDHHGDFSQDDPEWNAQARLTEAIIRKFGEAAPSTVDEYIKDPLLAWRERRPKT
jgi:hypothetical protein